MLAVSVLGNAIMSAEEPCWLSAAAADEPPEAAVLLCGKAASDWGAGKELAVYAKCAVHAAYASRAVAPCVLS